MKRLLPILALLLCHALQAQELSLTFTSVSDAKFFVYLNGKLQNPRSSGMVTLNNLEDKDYHVRIVIDDPYEVQLTRTLRPSPTRSEYTVLFNAVRERIYLRPVKSERGDEQQYRPSDSGRAPEMESPAPTATPQRHAATLRRTNQHDSVTQRILNRVRTQGYDD